MADATIEAAFLVELYSAGMTFEHLEALVYMKNNDVFWQGIVKQIIKQAEVLKKSEQPIS